MTLSDVQKLMALLQILTQSKVFDHEPMIKRHAEGLTKLINKQEIITAKTVETKQ
jgi:hypothetical protein